MRSIPIVLCVMATTLACHHTFHHTPDVSTETHPIDPSPPIIEAFVPSENGCQWVQINAETGQVDSTVRTEFTECPTQVHRSVSEDGNQLFTVWNQIWRLDTGTESMVALPSIYNLELSWWDNEDVQAITFLNPADLDPYANQAEFEAELEERDGGFCDLLYEAPCYTYRLENEHWVLINEEIIPINEERGGPYCTTPIEGWSSNWNHYERLPFEVFEDSTEYIEDMPHTRWGIVYELDATQNGTPCIQDCDDGALIRRYAISIEPSIDGDFRGGNIISANEHGDWQRVNGLDGQLRDLFHLDEQLILCTTTGFGAWSHTTAEPIWWKPSPSCPFRPTITMRDVTQNTPREVH